MIQYDHHLLLKRHWNAMISRNVEGDIIKKKLQPNHPVQQLLRNSRTWPHRDPRVQKIALHGIFHRKLPHIPPARLCPRGRLPWRHGSAGTEKGGKKGMSAKQLGRGRNRGLTAKNKEGIKACHMPRESKTAGIAQRGVTRGDITSPSVIRTSFPRRT